MSRGRPRKRVPLKYKHMRSRFEQHVAARLDELGIPWEYEKYAFEYLKPIRSAVCEDCDSRKVAAKRQYTPDFYLPEYKVFLEVKGRFGQQDRMKMRQVVEQVEGERFIMVFSRDNLIGRKATTRTRYTEYARNYGMGAMMFDELSDESIRRES
jgi:hypothetical protein